MSTDAPRPSNEQFSVGAFFGGMAVGVIFSAIVYVCVAAGQVQTPWPLFIPVVFKAIGGAVLCFHPVWRPFGAGLLASIPVAGMILIALCFALVFSM